MVGKFLIRGMLCGIVAGLLVFVFAKIFGEPRVDGAIAIEDQIAHAAGEAAEPELVSRAVQATWGLFTGTVLFSIAMGGLYALVFSVAWGRFGRLSGRAMAAWIALAGFVGIYLVPFLKYPANPPAVGNPETIGYRTALYFGVVLASIVAIAAAVSFGRAVFPRIGRWYAVLAAVGCYLLIMFAVYWALPNIDEVPSEFPAALLWQFRIVALGMQAILWATIGLLFGELTERAQRQARPATPFPHQGVARRAR